MKLKKKYKRNVNIIKLKNHFNFIKKKKRKEMKDESKKILDD